MSDDELRQIMGNRMAMAWDAPSGLPAFKVLSLLDECDALAERAAAAEAEVEALKHDIERHIGIASSEAEYADKLHKALREFAIYPAGFIGGSFNGNAMGCRLCKARFWRHGEREHHALDCLARPVAPPTEGA